MYIERDTVGATAELFEFSVHYRLHCVGYRSLTVFTNHALSVAVYIPVQKHVLIVFYNDVLTAIKCLSLHNVVGDMLAMLRRGLDK